MYIYTCIYIYTYTISYSVYLTHTQTHHPRHNQTPSAPLQHIHTCTQTQIQTNTHKQYHIRYTLLSPKRLQHPFNTYIHVHKHKYKQTHANNIIFGIPCSPPNQSSKALSNAFSTPSTSTLSPTPLALPPATTAPALAVPLTVGVRGGAVTLMSSSVPTAHFF